MRFLPVCGLILVLALSACGGGGGAVGMGTVPGAAVGPLAGPVLGASGGGGTGVGGTGAGGSAGGAPPAQSSGPRREGVGDFADGAALLRVTDPAAGSVHLVLTPDGAGFEGTDLDIDAASILILSEGPEGTLFTAEGRDAGGAPVVVALWRAGCGATLGCEGPGLAYLRRPEGGFAGMQAFGSVPAQVPSGSFSYSGVHLLALSADRGLQAGSFEMQVNFDTARAALTARTDDFSVSGGGIVIDRDTGAFAGSSLAIHGLEAGPVQARIVGGFHGVGAEGVSAIYHEVAPTPRLFGAIAGKK